MSSHFKEMLLQVNSGNSLNGMRFWFTAEKPLPLSLLNGSNETSTFDLKYDLIDDLLICVQIIPINISVYRIFHLAAFLPVWLIRETMPELSMNACTLTLNNTNYYRFDGKNANGKLSHTWLPMGGGGYGSVASTTLANRANVAWLLNYDTAIPQDDIQAMKFCKGWHFTNGVFDEYAYSVLGYITDLNLPNAVIPNAVILANKKDYMEYMATTYDLTWWEMALQTQYSRVKDPVLRQKVLDNLLITCNVSSQNSYNSAYRTYNITPQAYSVSPLSNKVLQAAWLQRVDNFSDTGNFFGFYGKLPAYAHFKFTTSNYYTNTTNITQGITRMVADFEDGIRYDWTPKAGFMDIDKLYKYMCNKNTGWTGSDINTMPTMNADYIIRDAYSKKMQQVTGDIDFKSSVTCPTNYGSKSMVNLGLAQKEISNVPILSFDFPGVKQ